MVLFVATFALAFGVVASLEANLSCRRHYTHIWLFVDVFSLI
jgi:hypothetical protein